jgi:hypothetical protein
MMPARVAPCAAKFSAKRLSYATARHHEAGYAASVGAEGYFLLRVGMWLAEMRYVFEMREERGRRAFGRARAIASGIQAVEGEKRGQSGPSGEIGCAEVDHGVLEREMVGNSGVVEDGERIEFGRLWEGERGEVGRL